MFPFQHVYPEIAERETRTISIKNHPGLPDAGYGLIENYCIDPTCDCRRTLIFVLKVPSALGGSQIFPDQVNQVATINHAFDPQPQEPLGQTFLDPLNKQSKLADHLLALFKDALRQDPAYAARLERHYQLVKEAVRDPNHPVQRYVKETGGVPRRVPVVATPPRAGRNDPCPCGSGKKYKRCCLDRDAP